MLSFLLTIGLLASVFLIAAVGRLWYVKKDVTQAQLFTVTLAILAGVILLLPSSLIGLINPALSVQLLNEGGVRPWLALCGLSMMIIGTIFTFIPNDLLGGIHTLEKGVRKTKDKKKQVQTVGIVALRCVGVVTIGLGILFLVATVELY